MKKLIACSLTILLLTAVLLACCTASGGVHEQQIGVAMLREGEKYTVSGTTISFTLIDSTMTTYQTAGKTMIEISPDNGSSERALINEAGDIKVDNKRIELKYCGDSSAVFYIYETSPG